MNRGDTAYLLLNYTLNGSPLVQNAYQEIELQLNYQKQPGSPFAQKSVKKLLSAGDIVWGTLSYNDGAETKTFTGYYCTMSQEDTFNMTAGENLVQLRILVNDEVGSSAITSVTFGQVLSVEVLDDNS